jgi:hypothetical protein
MGHAVPYYQPETAYEVFRRVTNDLDIPTGKRLNLFQSGSAYTTEGPKDTWGWKHVLPAMPQPECYLLNLAATCQPAVERALRNGRARIDNYVVSVSNDTQGIALRRLAITHTQRELMTVPGER